MTIDTTIDVTPIEETAPPPSIPMSKALQGVINLLFEGKFPGTHCQLVVESVTLLQLMIQNELAEEERKAKEANGKEDNHE